MSHPAAAPHPPDRLPLTGMVASRAAPDRL